MRLISRILSILTPAQRRRYILLQVYFVFAALVQIAGAASVAPFIALLSNPAIIHTNGVARQIFVALHLTSDKDFLIGFALVLMVSIVVSNAVVAIATWWGVSFSLRLGVETQRDIYYGFLHRDFVELSRTSSTDLVAAITQNVPRFIYMVVQPLLNLTSQAIIVLLIVAGLVWYDFRVALFAGILVGGGYAVVFSMLRQRLAHHGSVSWVGQKAKQRLLTESLGGIKEIRLLGTEHRYERGLTDVTEKSLHSDMVVGLLADLPKFVLESIAFCALLGLGSYLLAVADRPQDIVGVLSLYAMAGYKLLPAAQTVFKSAAQIRANSSIVAQLGPDIEAGRAALAARPAHDRIVAVSAGNIVLDDVWFRYPETEAPVIKGISLEIKRNSIAVLVGASGAGKSTLADLLLGLLRPSRGSIRVGSDSITENTTSWQRSIGYVPQSIFILDDTVAANISFGSPADVDVDKIRKAATLANVDRFIASLPGQYQFRVGERGALLSGGQRQRIGIARALYHDAAVLVLDEATSALDTLTEQEIIATLVDLKRSKTIVMIAHRLSTIKCADQVIYMEDGRLVDVGGFDDLVERNDAFRAVVVAGSTNQPVVDRDVAPIE